MGKIFNNRKEAEANIYVYSPKYQQKLLINSQQCNYGLFFQKMCRWQNEDGKISKDTGIENYYLWNKDGSPLLDKKGNQKAEKKSVRDDYAEYPVNKSNELLNNQFVRKQLEEINKNQKAFLDSMKSNNLFPIHRQAKLTSPFITGLGSGHPTETGMILDRNTGIPYIPASSIKGVLRLAYAVYLVEKRNETSSDKTYKIDENDPEIVKLFGGTVKEDGKDKTYRGQLIILDAFPDSIPTLKVDIMNPHFGSYYAGDKPTDKRGKELNKQPIETESPVPIKFITVAEKTIFNFNIIYKPLPGKEETIDVNLIKEIFNIAFERIGFGGKTAIGYGRFKRID